MHNLLQLQKRPLPHPCFDEKVGRTCGRIHLPVAPACNIQCAYCSRAYDCVNESRPGVTSRIMDPDEAASYLGEMLIRMPFATVAGIAGPGDAFCDPQRTLAALELIRRAHPRLNLCLSTNGLNITPYIKDLRRLGVGYVTVTVNAATPETGAMIYSYVKDGRQVLRGTEGAELLIGRQFEAISALAAEKIRVKVNTVVVSGINAGEVNDIARRASELGAGIMNIIPVIPVPGTPLEHAPPLSASEIEKLRISAAGHIGQMRHCVRCRADAAGLLHCREAKDCLPGHTATGAGFAAAAALPSPGGHTGTAAIFQARSMT